MFIGTDDERVPLQPRTSSFREAEENVPNRAQYYQSVVDDARKYVVVHLSLSYCIECALLILVTVSCVTENL